MKISKLDEIVFSYSDLDTTLIEKLCHHHGIYDEGHWHFEAWEIESFVLDYLNQCTIKLDNDN
jgi:hypothetical protein